MSRPKKTPLERAAAAVAAISANRRQALRDRVEEIRTRLSAMGREQRRLARRAKGVEVSQRIVWAQGSEDGARDVGKLLALLDAIGGAS